MTIDKKKLRKEMRTLKKLGKDYSHLATCPTSYQIYKAVKFN